MKNKISGLGIRTDNDIIRQVLKDPELYQDMLARATDTVGPDYNYGYRTQVAPNGHRGDIGKLPNHPTFSTGSAYSTPQEPGGEWVTTFQGTRFKPSLNQLTKPGYHEMIQRYMQQVEPGVQLDTSNKIPFDGVIRQSNPQHKQQ